MQTSLHFQSGPSDKVYHIQMEKVSLGYNVNFQYGRRGSCLVQGTKTDSPVDKLSAQKIFDKLLKDKISKGYLETSSTKTESTTDKEAPKIKKTVIKAIDSLPQLLNPIENPEVYNACNDFFAQEKKDGERRILVCKKGKINQFNRKGLEVPTESNIIESLGNLTITLDGEMVGEKFFAFDILDHEGINLRKQTAIFRINLLSSLSVKLGKSIEIVNPAISTKEKKALFSILKKRNAEGIVYKRSNSPYTSGRPNSGGDQLKCKFYKTASFIVDNYTKNKRSVGLVVLDKNGFRVPIGKVTISPNFEVPKIDAIVEVRYLYAFKDGCIFQPTFLGVRKDLDFTDASQKQLIYKEEN